MYQLQRLLGSQTLDNGERVGDVVPLTDITQPIDVVPAHGATINHRLTHVNSLEIPVTFLLNNFDEKETYYSLLSEFL